MNTKQFAETRTISEFLSLWLESDLLHPSEQQVLLSYYSSYAYSFPARIRYYYDRQTREVMELLSRIRDCRLLEVGCGCGTESLWLALQGARVDSIDLNQERLSVARQRALILKKELGRELPVRFFSSSILGFQKAEYDIIWMEQAFHHLEPRQEVVARLAALLKPGGWLVISEANGWNPLLQLQLLLKRGCKTIKTFVDHEGMSHLYGNERVLGAWSLQRLLARNGFRCRKISHFRLFPNHPLFSSMTKIEKSMPKCLVPLFTHYNYVGQKLDNT